MKDLLDQFLSEKSRLENIFENQDLDILIRVDAGLELFQLLGQDRFRAALTIQKVRNLIWNNGVK